MRAKGFGFLFHRISNLSFSEDLEKELFLKCVAGIYNCENVGLPKGFPELLKKSRIKNFPIRLG